MTQVPVQENPQTQVPVPPAAPVEGQEATPVPAVEEKPEKVKRGSPVYAVQPVAELPKRNHAGGGLHTRDLKSIYSPLLAEVAGHPENWFQIAAFTSTTGARAAAKALAEATIDGTIPVEPGTGNFTFESRRNVPTGELNEDGTAKVQPSILYGRFDYPVQEPTPPQA